MKQNPASLIQFKTATPRFLIAIALVLACFGFSPAPNAFGVVPAPDGGYPGFNTAEGTNALKNLTTGVGNAAVGWYSLFSNTDGSYNTGVGAGTLLLNIGNQSTGEGTENTAIGAAALLFNTTGHQNTANGAFALFSNTEGTANTANGSSALKSNTTGNGNTANGLNALLFNTDGSGNTANGSSALRSNTNGDNNTATGFAALTSNTIGFNNTATGLWALFNNTEGDGNTSNGMMALFNNTTGRGNTASGWEALRNNTEGEGNTAIGVFALHDTTGDSNIALGVNAGAALTTGNGNIDIGNSGVASESNTIRIGDSQTRTFIAGISGATASGGVAVYVNSAGQLGTLTSSARFKQDIHSMDNASEAILALKPVTFRYKPELDKAGIPQFGLVAEEVAEVNPDLVVRDEKGEIYTVRYEAVNAMLLNEFLKEHRKVEQLQKQIEALGADLQKVSTLLEGNIATRQVVLNNQ